MSYSVTLIPGDGIGEEIAESMQQVLKAAGAPISWDKQSAGLKAAQELGNALPEATLKSIQNNQVALKGPTTTPIGSGHKSANVLLRQALDLYASVRPVKSVPGVQTRYDNVDLVIIRENTEGLYAAQEAQVTPDTILSFKVVTKKATHRIAQFALDYCKKHKRQRLTVGHKANIMKLGDGFFLDTARELASIDGKVPIDDCIVDALCMKLVTNPNQFDVLLLENLYGDIVSDLCAGLVGGLGLVPGANLGEKIAVFESVHGSAPDIAGKNKANPTALIQSAIMMLYHLNETNIAQQIESALYQVLKKPELRTSDLGGSANTQEFTQHVISAL
ncbi:MAG: isocitrate/isopropylmalate dehydrogenase family protein [Deltaproteobacteria bacterium]|nr:isocitrate/isopropylmalate dehydrogenase family protein [Deltaproteobacteria bacterium]